MHYIWLIIQYIINANKFWIINATYTQYYVYAPWHQEMSYSHAVFLVIFLDTFAVGYRKTRTHIRQMQKTQLYRDMCIIFAFE